MRLFAFASVLAAAVYYYMSNNDNAATPSTLTDPAGLAARARAAIRNVVTGAEQRKILETQARLETGNFKSKALLATNSLFNRHKGSGRGEWTGKTYYANASDPDLRVYSSMEQSVRDMLNLLNDPLYKDALNYYLIGDPLGYFAAVARGNGKTGFVGDPNAKKAKDYVAGLARTYQNVA